MVAHLGKIDAHVGARAKAFRLKAKMSQTEVGKALGVTFQQVQKYEKGTNRIGPSRLAEMARLFRVPVGAFFNNSNNHSGNGDEEIADVSLIRNRGRARLMKLLDRIDDQRYDSKLADMAEFHLSNMTPKSKR